MLEKDFQVQVLGQLTPLFFCGGCEPPLPLPPHLPWMDGSHVIIVYRHEEKKKENNLSVLANKSCKKRSPRFSSLLLTAAQTQRLAYAAEAQSAEQLVNAQAAQQAVDDTAEPKTVEKLADQTEDTAEQ